MIDARIPPHDLGAEASVLGALMLDPAAVVRVSDFLKTEDFYLDHHAQVYRAVLDLVRRSEPIDIITVAAELGRSNVLEPIGGQSFLAELQSGVPTSANVEHYGRIVEEKAARRRLISVAASIAEMGYEDAANVQDVLNAAEQAVFKVAERRGGAEVVSLRESMKDTYEAVERMQHDRSSVAGVPSGFHDLDAITGGWQRSDLVIVAARPSVGKTAFLLNVAQHAANEGVPVVVFSLEMSRHQLNMRLLSSEANIDANRVRQGMLRTEEWPHFVKAFGVLSEAPIWIDDSAMLTTMEMRTRARRLKAAHGLGLVVVDYLQLVAGRGNMREFNRTNEVAEISRSLKIMAKELNVPVIAAAQLNRSPEMRSNHRPMLSDLRESGSIEADADLVLFLYREALYSKDLPPDEKRIAEVIISKHRNGPVGDVKLIYVEAQTKFANLQREAR